MYIAFLFLPVRFDPDAQSHPEVPKATQKGCSYAGKKSIRESHVPCERSGAAVDLDVLGHKNDSCGRADAHAGVISLEPVRAVSRKAEKANSIAS
jgi:hypothetical protein